MFSRFGVRGFTFRFRGSRISRFRISGLVFRIHGSGFPGLGFRVRSFRVFEVLGFEFGVSGFDVFGVRVFLGFGFEFRFMVSRFGVSCSVFRVTSFAVRVSCF